MSPDPRESITCTGGDEAELVSRLPAPLAVGIGENDRVESFDYLRSLSYVNLWRGEVQVAKGAADSPHIQAPDAFNRLLATGREGGIDILVAEALDRLSRDLGDAAQLCKQLSFLGIRLVTLAEGEISELHVGLKGTLNGLFLKDLADTTRTGLRGRVEQGRSGGGNAYGYDVVRRMTDSGDTVRGERRMNPDQAAIVRRILEAYAAGTSPRHISLQLNGEGVPGPSGKAWGASTINGNRARNHLCRTHVKWAKPSGLQQ